MVLLRCLHRYHSHREDRKGGVVPVQRRNLNNLQRLPKGKGLLRYSRPSL